MSYDVVIIINRIHNIVGKLPMVTDACTMILFALLYCLVISTHLGLCDEEFDYYWRDYNGLIPADAIPGGLDLNGHTTYIGQVYLHGRGVIPAQIYPGEKSVTAAHGGAQSSDLFIKILCSLRKENFVWYPATAKDLHVVTVGRHLVAGGTQDDRILNIGRIQYQGELIVGKVTGFDVGNAKMSFPHRNTEMFSQSYEILLYDNNRAVQYLPILSVK